MSRVCSVAVLAALIVAGVLVHAAFAAEPSFNDVLRDAQTAVDTWRPDAAIALFGKAAALAPDRSDALSLDRSWAFVEKGYIAYRMKDFAVAADDFAKAVEICPDIRNAVTELWAVSRLTLFWQMEREAVTRAGADWQGLIDHAEGTVSIVPEWPEAHYALGVANEYGGRVDEAQAEYRTAAGIAGGPRLAIAASRDAAYHAARASVYRCAMPMHPLLAKADAGEFDVFRRGRLIIHHHNAELADRSARAIEYYMSQPVLGGVLEGAASPPDDCNVFIYESHGELTSVRSLSDWAIGYFSCAITRRGVGALELHFQQDAPELFGGGIPHELGHLRLRTHRRYVGDLPAWIHEGIAVAAEPASTSAFYRGVLASAAQTGELIPAREIMRLRSTPAREGCDVFYAESMAMVSALAERGGSARFWDFLTRLGALGQRDALEEVYGMSPEDLQQLAVDWASGAATDPASGADDAPMTAASSLSVLTGEAASPAGE